jgi:hypothetical protein
MRGYDWILGVAYSTAFTSFYALNPPINLTGDSDSESDFILQDHFTLATLILFMPMVRHIAQSIRLTVKYGKNWEQLTTTMQNYQ